MCGEKTSVFQIRGSLNIPLSLSMLKHQLLVTKKIRDHYDMNCIGEKNNLVYEESNQDNDWRVNSKYIEDISDHLDWSRRADLLTLFLKGLAYEL